MSTDSKPYDGKSWSEVIRQHLTEDEIAATKAAARAELRGVPEKVARRNRLGLSVQLPLLLDDGRALVVQRYDAATMTCRQLAKGATLQAGETIHSAADKDGSRLRLRVDEVKPGRKRLLVLRVLGRVLPKAAP